MLIGTKHDLVENGPGSLPRATNKSDIESFCSQNGLKYFETSAKTGHNVKQSFQTLLESIFAMGLDNPGNHPPDSSTITLSSHLRKSKTDDSTCC